MQGATPVGQHGRMPTPPESTKSSLEQRLSAHARQRWPTIDLAVRHRAGFAYADAHLPNGEVLPLLRLRYGGSATYWGVALYRPSTGNTKIRFGSPGRPSRRSTSPGASCSSQPTSESQFDHPAANQPSRATTKGLTVATTKSPG